VLDRRSFDSDRTDLHAANRVALFQYMIGNTDWSIVRERNVTLLLGEDGYQRPLPFDFDMSGLVNAHYAGPAPGLPIDDVTERFYLGFCDPETDWEQLFGEFLNRQQEDSGPDWCDTRSGQKQHPVQPAFSREIFRNPAVRAIENRPGCRALPALAAWPG
jgi:hypothetical protein